MLWLCLLWSPLQLAIAPRNYLAEFLWLSGALEGLLKYIRSPAFVMLCPVAVREIWDLPCYVYMSKGDKCVCALGSRMPHFCKELCECTWSLTWGMQHRESRGVHCYSEAVILVYVVLVTLAGNCSCYFITGTARWSDCRSVQKRSSELTDCW